MNIIVITDIEGTDHEFNVGRPNAAQVAAIMRILSTVLRKVSSEIRNSGSEGDNLAIVAGLLGSLTEDQLVDLASVLIGSDKQFAADNFDLVWVTEALACVIEESNLAQVIQNFTRMFARIQS